MGLDVVAYTAAVWYTYLSQLPGTPICLLAMASSIMYVVKSVQLYFVPSLVRDCDKCIQFKTTGGRKVCYSIYCLYTYRTEISVSSRYV